MKMGPFGTDRSQSEPNLPQGMRSKWAETRWAGARYTRTAAPLISTISNFAASTPAFVAVRRGGASQEAMRSGRRPAAPKWKACESCGLNCRGCRLLATLQTRERVLRLGVIGLDPQGFLIVPHGLLDPAHLFQADPQLVVCLGVIGLDP